MSEQPTTKNLAGCRALFVYVRVACRHACVPYTHTQTTLDDSFYTYNACAPGGRQLVAFRTPKHPS
jgi:hypothetical protein